MAGLAVVVLFSIPVLFMLWLTAVPGASHSGPLAALSLEEQIVSPNLNQHIKALGSKPHNIEHYSELKKAETYIEQQLTDYGFTVSKQPFKVGEVTVHNFDVVIKPVNADAPTLVIGAHYDSYGKAPGANDNGSGTAAALEMARLLKDIDGQSELRIRIAFFVNEEPPYFKSEHMGSAVYANALSETDEDIVGMISLETMGYFSDEPNSQNYPPPLSSLYPSEGNFIAFVGDTSARSFVRTAVRDFRELVQFPSEGGTAPSIIQGIDWSDHRSFSAINVPALMVTDTAAFRYPDYHGRADTPDKVDTEKLARVVFGLSKVVRKWANDGFPD